MEFIASHWHCILPAAAMALLMLLRSRNRKKQDDT
jgi:hypothetical protein